VNEIAPTSDRSGALQNDGVPSRGQMLEELRALYAETLEFPHELVTAEADLEADLGIDSLTQNELMDHALARYGLSTYMSDVRATSYTTLAEVVGLIQQLSLDGTVPRRHR
jgi:[acyl-carrier-protein] S-malonyltransferase